MQQTKKAKKVPYKTPEEREQYLISLAMDRAEERLKDGTATAAEIVHFLKLGTPREEMERDILSEQKKLITAKTDAIQSSKDIKMLYEDAIKSMQRYSGRPENE